MSSNDTQESQMKLSNFEIIRTLGRGSFGSVKYAKSKLDGQYYALKFMKKHDIIKMKQGMLSTLFRLLTPPSGPHQPGTHDNATVESSIHRQYAGFFQGMSTFRYIM